MPGVEERGRIESKNPSRVNRSLWNGGKPTKVEKKGQKLPTNITGPLTLEQICAYQAMYRIEEITDLLNNEHLKLPEYILRSQSPPPKYDAQGRRTNTKEQMYRKKLEMERYRLVEIAWRMIPFYTHPEGYIKPSTFEEKYYIPVDQYPDINFVGLLLGPRGNTLKRLQLESKCKIAIRGRGSVKEGKSASDLPEGAMNMEDPLHCLVIADSEDKVIKGIKCCQGVVIKAVTSPEGQNDLKRNQLRDLAELNGTLREDTSPCSICGLKGHKKYDCPERESFAFRIICHNCGQPGHITRDCQAQFPQNYSNNNSSTNKTPNRYHLTAATSTPPNNNTVAKVSDFKQAQEISSSRYQVPTYQSRYYNFYSANNGQDTSTHGDGRYASNVRRYQSRYQRTIQPQQRVEPFNNTSNDMNYYNNRHNNHTLPQNNLTNINSNDSLYANESVKKDTPVINVAPGLDNFETSITPPGISNFTSTIPGLEVNEKYTAQRENSNSGGIAIPPGLKESSLQNPSLPPGLSNPNIEDSTSVLPPGLSPDASSENSLLPPGLAGPPGI